MTDLIVCLGKGKGTRLHVEKLIQEDEWNSVFIVCSKDNSKDFSVSKKHEFIFIDNKKNLQSLVEDIEKELKGRISGVEVALNFISGNGKENMAVLSAILKSGFAIRLVAFTIEGVREV